jgi:plastocyanin
MTSVVRGGPPTRPRATNNNIVIIIGLILIVIIVTVAGGTSSVIVESSPQQFSSPTNIKVVMGERYFPDGTGTAFINDGTTLRFSHQVTPTNGYYYDNSTVFLAGLIPGFTKNFITVNPSLDEIANRSANDRFSYTPFYDNNNNSNAGGIMNSSSNAPPPAHRNVTKIIISNSITQQPGAQLFQPNIVRVHPGDLVTWINDDFQMHYVVSPPLTISKTYFPGVGLPSQQNFGTILEPGGTFSIIIPPIAGGGYHFNDNQFKNATGAIIIVEK